MPLTSDMVDHEDPLASETNYIGMMQPSFGFPPDSPMHQHRINQDLHSPTPTDIDFNLDLDFELDPDQIVESVCSYDSDVPGSPTLSNKGVPNMFPVSDTDFLGKKDSSPPSFGNLSPSYHRWSGLEGEEWRSSDSLPSVSPTNLPYQAMNVHHQDMSLTHQSTGPNRPTTSLGHQNTSFSHQSSSPTIHPPSFNFYHQDIRLGQTRQFDTLGRKHEHE